MPSSPTSSSNSAPRTSASISSDMSMVARTVLLVALWHLPRVDLASVRPTVLFGRLGGMAVITRVFRCSEAFLDWELSLLEHLARSGMFVPRVVPTRDGRRHSRDVHVLERTEGRAPRPGDDAAVRRVVARLDETTRRWPRRSSSASGAELLRAAQS